MKQGHSVVLNLVICNSYDIADGKREALRFWIIDYSSSRHPAATPVKRGGSVSRVRILDIRRSMIFMSAAFTLD
jgi:hypothetical protein